MVTARGTPAFPDIPQYLTIRHSTYIRADAIQAYQALTISQGSDAWVTPGANVNARPGGEIHFRWVNWDLDLLTTIDGGPMLEATPGEGFVFQWHPDSPHYASTVETNLTSTVGGTIVSLREHMFAATPSGFHAMLSCTTGWGEAPTLLKFYLEHSLPY
jgi:uncharacterized protein YndB with AHSA1/START domain